jgi:hypothetical protein
MRFLDKLLSREKKATEEPGAEPQGPRYGLRQPTEEEARHAQGHHEREGHHEHWGHGHHHGHH